MKRISLTDTAHQQVREVLQPGDIAIDATTGNGHDCLFLAGLVGETGHVFGFDIQSAALQATLAKLQEVGVSQRTTLIQASHADLDLHIPMNLQGKIKVIMFNLGYLPGGDKTIITQTESTLQALTKAGQMLADQGLLTIMAYPGHPGGALETQQVEHWCAQLNPLHFTVATLSSSTENNSAPKLITITKRPC